MALYAEKSIPVMIEAGKKGVQMGVTGNFGCEMRDAVGKCLCEANAVIGDNPFSQNASPTYETKEEALKALDAALCSMEEVPLKSSADPTELDPTLLELVYQVFQIAVALWNKLHG